MPGIFINYRRDDAPGVAGRLYDYLAKSFSHRDLFIDVDYIKPGLDFVKQLDNQVSQCDVMLALIGPHWLTSEDEQGQRRLHGNKDYVRIEIASALRRDIPVIPVLVDGAEMPTENELPEDLKSLTLRQALELRHTRFASDADAIAGALKASLPRRNKRWVWPLAAAACLIGVLGVWFLYLWPGPTPPEPQVSTVPAQTQAPAQLSTIVLQGSGQTADLRRTGADNWEWVESNNTYKFRTVSETSSELVINDASRDIYHRLNLLTGETFWRTGTSGGWIPYYRIVSQSVTRAVGGQMFNDPMVGSLPLDGCLYFARECGEPAATAWCASKGFAKATTFTGFRNVPQTSIIGDGSVCHTGPTVSCGTFTSITCGSSG
jgi:hypothetical protein